MKTPIKELINQLSDIKNGLIAEKLNAQEDDFDFIDGMIHNLTSVITLLRQAYLDKEKLVIENAFLDGYLHSLDDGFPEYARNYYNETFNTKEK